MDQHVWMFLAGWSGGRIIPLAYKRESGATMLVLATMAFCLWMALA